MTRRASDPDEPKPLTGALIVAGAIGLLAVLLVWLTISQPTTRSTPTTVAAPTGVSAAAGSTAAVVPVMPPPAASPPLVASSPLVAATVSSADPTASSCGLPGGDQHIPVIPPSGVRWQIVGGRMAAPLSDVLGPGRVVDGIGTCYARSPGGALLAAMGALALTAALPGEIDQVAVVTARGASGGHYAQALTEAARAKSGSVDSPPIEHGQLPRQEFLGYEFIYYAPDIATINIAVGIGDPGKPSSYTPMLTPVTVRWEAGDWRMVYAPVTGQPVISAAQYTKWGAQ